MSVPVHFSTATDFVPDATVVSVHESTACATVGTATVNTAINCVADTRGAKLWPRE